MAFGRLDIINHAMQKVDPHIKIEDESEKRLLSLIIV